MTQNWNKSFTYIEPQARAGAVGREGCCELNPSLYSIYFRLSGLQPSFLLIHFGYCLDTCSHCTFVWHKLYDMKRSIFEIGAAPLLSVTEIAPTVMFYVWKETLSGARAILYSVNIFFRSNRLAITACFSCDWLLDLRCKTLKDLVHLKIGTFLMNKSL